MASTCSTLLTLLRSKTLGTTPPKMNEFLPKNGPLPKLFHLPTIHAYRLLRDMLKKFFHLPTIHLGDMLVGGSTITLVQDSSGTLACVFQAPGERVHPFQEKRKSVMKDRGHYITNPNKALLSGNTSNLPCIRIVWSPKMGNWIMPERWTPSTRVSVPNHGWMLDDIDS